MHSDTKALRALTVEVGIAYLTELDPDRRPTVFVELKLKQPRRRFAEKAHLTERKRATITAVGQFIFCIGNWFEAKQSKGG